MAVPIHPAATFCRWLDRLRLGILRLMGPVGVFFVRRREWRLAAFGTVVVLSALAGTLFLPLWLLALGPIVLGTPHVLSDVRYLVMRPGNHRRGWWFWLLAGVPLAVAGCGFHPMQFGLAGVAAAGILASGSFVRKCVVALAAGCAAWVCWRAGEISQIIFAHVHNFVALALWWCWRPARSGYLLLIPAAFLCAAAGLSLGWIAPPPAAWAWFPGAMDAPSYAEALAPGLPLELGARVVLVFAFAQAVHYGIWLRLIPEDDRPRDTPRTFSASLRALENDVGKWVLGGAMVVAVGVAVWAVLDLAAARIGYLRMALFHGYLELIAAALLFVEGRSRFFARTAVSAAVP